MLGPVVSGHPVLVLGAFGLGAPQVSSAPVHKFEEDLLVLVEAPIGPGALAKESFGLFMDAHSSTTNWILYYIQLKDFMVQIFPHFGEAIFNQRKASKPWFCCANFQGQMQRSIFPQYY